MTEQGRRTAGEDVADIRADGDGGFTVSGPLTFDSVAGLLRRADGLFAGVSSIRLDLSAVSVADSAGLALLLEWRRLAISRRAEIEFVNVPAQMLAIADTTKLGSVLQTRAGGE